MLFTLNRNVHSSDHFKGMVQSQGDAFNKVQAKNIFPWSFDVFTARFEDSCLLKYDTVSLGGWVVHIVLTGPVTQWHSVISQKTWVPNIFPIIEQVVSTATLKIGPCSYKNSKASVLLLVISVHNAVVCTYSIFEYIYKALYFKFCSLLCSEHKCEFLNRYLCCCNVNLPFAVVINFPFCR